MPGGGGAPCNVGAGPYGPGGDGVGAGVGIIAGIGGRGWDAGAAGRIGDGAIPLGWVGGRPSGGVLNVRGAVPPFCGPLGPPMGGGSRTDEGPGGGRDSLTPKTLPSAASRHHVDRTTRFRHTLPPTRQRIVLRPSPAAARVRSGSMRARSGSTTSPRSPRPASPCSAGTPRRDRRSGCGPMCPRRRPRSADTRPRPRPRRSQR